MPCRVVGDERQVREPKPLTLSFVVEKQKGLVFLDWTTQRSTKLISLKGGNRGAVEEVPGIESAVAHELEHRTVQLVGAGLRDHADVRPGSFAVFGRIGSCEHVEFTDGIDA